MTDSAWIALAALLFAGTQAWVARRKLRFDLFQKRFDAWEALNDALNDFMDEVQHKIDEPNRRFDSEHLRKFWRQERTMALLFPPNVRECVSRIERAMIDWNIARAATFRGTQIIPPEDREQFAIDYQAFIWADRILRDEQDALLRIIHPHLRQYGNAEILYLFVQAKFVAFRGTFSGWLYPSKSKRKSS